MGGVSKNPPYFSASTHGAQTSSAVNAAFTCPSSSAGAFAKPDPASHPGHISPSVRFPGQTRIPFLKLKHLQIIGSLIR